MRFVGWPSWVLLSALAFSPGCRKIVRRHMRSRPQRVVAAPQRLVPLAAAQPWATLTLDHFEPATVSVPLGARWARPVVIAIHGRSDTAAASCAAWSTITAGDCFVLCPSLRAAGANEADASPADRTSIECLADELREGIVALRKRYGRYVARNEVALAGFDGGAERAIPIALQNPSVFSVLWLVNGGLKEWSSALSTTYLQRGGKLLGLVCTDASCELDALRVTASAHAAGLTTTLVKPGQFGISLDARVVQAARQAWRDTKPAAWPWSIPLNLNK